MRLLERLFIGGLALVLAIPCGALVLACGVLLDPDGSEAIGRLGMRGLIDLASGVSPEMTLMVLAALAQGVAVLLVAPPVLGAIIGEALRLRALAWYGGASGCLTAILPWLARPGVRPQAGHEALAAEGRLTAILFVVGAASGLVYWLVAGRSAAVGATATS